MSEMTALHLAAIRGYTNVAMLLIEEGGWSLEARNLEGATSLLMAARNGCAETVAYLLSCGADMNTQDNNKWTPLHEASFKGHNEVVEYLLIAGANIKIEDRNGRTALMRAHDEVTRTVFHLRRPQWREEGYDRH